MPWTREKFSIFREQMQVPTTVVPSYRLLPNQIAKSPCQLSKRRCSLRLSIGPGVQRLRFPAVKLYIPSRPSVHSSRITGSSFITQHCGNDTVRYFLATIMFCVVFGTVYNTDYLSTYPVKDSSLVVL